MTRPRAAFLLSILAIWIVSSAVDWTYAPWGNITAPVIYCVASLECLAAAALFAASLIRTGGGVVDLFWYCVALTICAGAEFVLWRSGILNAGDKGQLLRLSGAAILAPLPTIAGGLLIRRTPAREPRNVKQLVLYAAGSMLLGLAVLVAIYVIREAPLSATGAYGEDYAMLQTMLFAVALLSALSGLAAAFAGISGRPNRSIE